MPTRHRLGPTAGTMLEYDDGTAGYVAPGRFTQQFRVRIADMTEFSVTRDRRVLERMLNVMGDGVLLGSASVQHKESGRHACSDRGGQRPLDGRP